MSLVFILPILASTRWKHAGYESQTACGPTSDRITCDLLHWGGQHEDLFVPSSGPNNWCTTVHTSMIQFHNNLSFLEHQHRPHNNLNEDMDLQSDNDSYHPWWPQPDSSVKWHHLISLIGSAAFTADWLGEEVYTINIQPTSDYLDISLASCHHQPAPTSALHSEPFYRQVELFAKVVLRCIKFLHVFQEKRLRACLPLQVDQNHLRMIRCLS